MFASDLAGILFALTSAVIWGSGDFSGGYASRRSNQFQVLALAAFSGIVVLLALAVLTGEWLPSPRSLVFAMSAGVVGALGVAALYRALSLGHAASVAPTAAVIGAVLPVLFGIATEGAPATGRLIGFGLACLGIWLVSQVSTAEGGTSRQALALACFAGACFGGFFILIAQTERDLLFAPLVVARGFMFCTALVLLFARRLPLLPAVFNPVALLAGVLDAGGNVFYMLARQFTRLDVAAVLASLYPASTVLLASLLLKEQISRTQWVGVALCLAAIALITY